MWVTFIFFFIFYTNILFASSTENTGFMNRRAQWGVSMYVGTEGGGKCDKRGCREETRSCSPRSGTPSGHSQVGSGPPMPLKCERTQTSLQKLCVPGRLSQETVSGSVCRSVGLTLLTRPHVLFWNQKGRGGGWTEDPMPTHQFPAQSGPSPGGGRESNIDRQTGEYLLSKYWWILIHYLLNQSRISHCLDIIKWNGLWKLSIKIWVKFPPPHLKKNRIPFIIRGARLHYQERSQPAEGSDLFRWQLSRAHGPTSKDAFGAVSPLWLSHAAVSLWGVLLSF